MKRLVLLLAVCGCSAVAGAPIGSRDVGSLAGYRGYDRYGDWYGERERQNKLAVRGGCYLPVAASDAGFKTGLVGGLALNKASRKRLYEFGVDYVLTESSNGRTRSSLYVARAALGVPVGGLSFPRKGAYVLGGVDFVLEDALDTVLDESNMYWSVDLDLGLGWKHGKLDLRMSYVVMLATDNVPGALVLSLGLLF